MLNTVTSKVMENAHVATYGGATSAVVVWGLHIGELCAIISTVVAVAGLVLQVYVAVKRHREKSDS